MAENVALKNLSILPNETWNVASEETSKKTKVWKIMKNKEIIN